MDFPILKQELLLAIRGRRSQLQVSRRLGYAWNQVNRWERGIKQIRWDEFVAMCRACKVDIDAALAAAFPQKMSADDSKELVRTLLAGQVQADVCRRLGFRPQTLSRWATGRSVPRLEDMLALLHNSTQFLPFLSRLIALDKIPTIAAEWERHRKIQEAALRYPLLGPAGACLELASYLGLDEHMDGYVADRLGITLKEELFLMDLLVSLGVIRLEGKKYKVTHNALFDPEESWPVFKGVRQFWLRRALDRLSQHESNPGSDFFGYALFAGNKKLKDKIREKWIVYFNSISQMILEDQTPGDELIVVNHTIFNLNR